MRSNLLLLWWMMLLTAVAYGQDRAGSLDLGFAPGEIVGAPVTQVAAQSDGKTIIVGKFVSIRGIARSYIARLNPDGSLDASFVPPIIESYDTRSDDFSPIDPRFQPLLQTVVVQDNKKIVVGGNFFFVNGVSGFGGLVRLNADGSVDGSFDPPRFSGTVNSIQPAPSGGYYVGGDFEYIGQLAQNALARLDAQGRLDKDFNAGKVSGQVITSAGTVADQVPGVRVLALQTDGKLLAGGNFSAIDGREKRGLARLNTDGSVDESFAVEPSFNPPFAGMAGTSNNEVHAITLQSDAKLLIGGSFRQAALDPSTGQAAIRNSLFRLNADGTADGSFNAGGTGVNGSVEAISVQPDGNIIFAGSFLRYDGQTLPNVARIHSDGSLDPSFDVGIGPNNSVLSLAIINNGRQLLVGGYFNLWDGEPRTYVSRINLTATTANGATVTIYPASRPAEEAGSVRGRFVVSRSGGDLSAPLNVAFRISGTASYGADYTLRGKTVSVAADGSSGSVQILGGKVSAVVRVVPVDDQIPEAKESVVLTLTANIAYGFGQSAVAKIKIIDND